jgi:hypothetical protein
MARQVRAVESLGLTINPYTNTDLPIVEGGTDALASNDGAGSFVQWVDGYPPVHSSPGLVYGELTPFTIPANATIDHVRFLIAADWSIGATARFQVNLELRSDIFPAGGGIATVTGLHEGNPLDYEGLTTPGWVTVEYEPFTSPTIGGPPQPLIDALNVTGGFAGAHLYVFAGTTPLGGLGSYEPSVTYLAVAVDYTIGTLPLRQRQRRDGLKSAGRGRQASSR